MGKRVFDLNELLNFLHKCNEICEIELPYEEVGKRILKAFELLGEPYEPDTPPATVAQPMCDEDKVWMAACSMSVGSMLNIKITIETAFKLLDEFRRQQKEREGWK